MGVDAPPEVDQDCEGTVPTITVTITGDLPMLFNLVGTSFPINRSVTFQDEGRPSPCAACGGFTCS
jgi:hypothetical protein